MMVDCITGVLPEVGMANHTHPAKHRFSLIVKNNIVEMIALGLCLTVQFTYLSTLSMI